MMSPFAFARRHKGWAAVAAVLVAAGAYWMTRGEEAPEAKPLYAPAQVGDVENLVTASGSLQPSQYVDVGAQVSGQLQHLRVDVGDTVAEGDLLAEIDATIQVAEVEASRASLRALESQMSARESALKLAQANAERQRRLIEEDATTELDVDRAIDQLTSAQASIVQLDSQIAQSRATLASEEALLGYTKIYAPMAGTVISIETKEGQTLNAVQQAPTILRVADLRTMTVQAQVSEADVSKLTPGMNVYFTTLGSGGRRWEGTLRQVLPKPETDGGVVQYTALFDVDNTDGVLLSDMTAQVFFVVAEARGVLTVPLAALKPAGVPPGRPMPPGMAAAAFPPTQGEATERKAAVEVRKADDSHETREITVGVISRVAAEVRGGLEEGEEVVAGIIQAPPPGGPGRPR
jgi:macrolide-specific efflux system membrane fusion protein